MKYGKIRFQSAIMIFIALFVFTSIFSGCKENHDLISHPSQETIISYPENYYEMDLPDYRLDIVHFWHECLESYYIGEAIKEILQEHYQEEVEQGLITYRLVRSQYLENSELVFNYKAMTEDFVTHLITEEKDEMKNHHFLWYIAEDEERLRQYLIDMLQSMMSEL